VYESPDLVALERSVVEHVRRGDPAAAVAAVAAVWPAVAALEGARLRELLDRIPEEAWSSDPWMLAAVGASYRSLDSSSRSAALPWFRAAETLLANAGAAGPEVAAVRVHHAAALRSLGLLEDAHRAASSAAALLDDDVSPTASLRIRDQCRAALQLGVVRLHAGDLDGALPPLRLALGLSDRNLTRAELVECLGALALHKLLRGDVSSAAEFASSARRAAAPELLVSRFGAATLVTEVLVAVEQSRVDDAAALLSDLVPACRRSDWEPMGEYAAATVAQARERHIEGLHHVRASLDSARGWQGAPAVRALARLLRGVLLMRLGEYATALSTFAATEPSRDHSICPARFVAAIRLKAGDAVGCLDALTACRELGEGHAPRPLVDVHLLAAAADYELDDAATADVAVDRALLLAGAGRLTAPFTLVSSSALHRMLLRAGDRPQPADARVLLELLRVDHALPASAVLEPLSERELDIASHLFEEKTVSQIASELYISINTVKTHVRSIYRKLSANNRRDAVRRVQELGLHRRITPRSSLDHPLPTHSGGVR